MARDTGTCGTTGFRVRLKALLTRVLSGTWNGASGRKTTYSGATYRNVLQLNAVCAKTSVFRVEIDNTVISIFNCTTECKWMFCRGADNTCKRTVCHTSTSLLCSCKVRLTTNVTKFTFACVLVVGNCAENTH